MRVDAKTFGNEAALHCLGATSVAEVRNDAGDLISMDITPDIDLSGYEDAVSATAKPPVPESISARQFFQAIAKDGVISQDEALAFMRTKTLPDALQGAVDGIKDADTKFAAAMLISGAMTFERQHPIVSVIGKALKKSDADLDAIWIEGAKL